ncbi:Oidioi.mRNA.OKI2018_I69.chr1.g828.t1.cds [Oikopleura dioica]|uniref:Oidioi.mRNA.OKI2018_I69.chr1.g828.t1.cds n=1 Tax=Oikopleura dioica TaxID=34765 RepID=A0ABN7ST83_OIKDI|nr:Oidioi.mRNA.OKI2018_I69.chr1.g828.t1.cds [Oikopleura dioica]
MKKIAIWQIFLFEFVLASTLIESQCSALPQNSSCTLNCTSRIYEDYLGDCSPTVSVVEICNSSRCSLLENKNVTGSTIVQSTCSTFLDNNNDCQLNCSSRTYPYSDSCSGDVFVTEICDLNSCEVLYSRAVTVDIVECSVMPQENLLCDGSIYKAAYNWDLFFPCFYYKNSDEIFCQKKSYSNSINITVPVTQPALTTTTTTSASNIPTWLPNLLENIGILAVGLFIGFFDDLFPAKEMITTTVATTTLAPENGLSDVVIAAGGFLTGILFLSLIEFLAGSQNNEILTTLAPTLSTILTTNFQEEDVQILDEFFVYDSCATSPQLFELNTGESFISPGSPLSYNFVNCDGELTNLKSVASNQGIQFNLVLSEYDPVDSRIDFSNSNGDVFSFDIDISDENCANPRHSAFRKSLEMGFLERQQISNFKMKFALLTEDEISEEVLINEASSSCYEALESMETGMIDCKIIRFSSPEPNTRSNSASNCKSSSEVTLVARFLDNLEVEIKEEIIQNISMEIENRLNSKDDDGKIGQNEVLGLLTPQDNQGLFIAQMVVLSFCLCIGLAASAFQVQMYRAGASGNARHKGPVK